MSELLQPGQHPDADQLSAFVEHVLPLHEQQQTLAHLAVCPDCRAIVSLSLPPLEESPKPKPELVRKPWFSGWRLALPAAAAFAALVVIIHVRNAASIKSSAPTTQMAVSQPPDTGAPLLSSESSSQLAARTQQPNSRSVATAGAAGRSQPQVNEVVAGSQPAAKLPLNSPQAQPMPSNGLAQLHGSTGGAAAGAGSALQAPTSVTLDRLQQKNSGAPPTDSTGQSSSATTMALRQQAVAGAKPSPVPSAAASVDTVNQKVEVTSASPVATLSSANNFALKETKSIVAEHPLPSRLAAISVASNANQTLAIDANNTLFLSDDGGQHWKAISPQWQGRAVKVALASAVRGQSYAMGGSNNPRTGANLGAIGGPVALPPPAAPALGIGSSVAGTITDPTGAAIPNASVVVLDATTRTVRGVTADVAGHYLVDDLTPGDYKVEAQAPGFTKQQLSVTLATSQQSQANLILQIGQASQTVSVEASPVSPATESLARKKTAAPQAARQPLPLFEITTDAGERWTSSDGQIWKHQ